MIVELIITIISFIFGFWIWTRLVKHWHRPHAKSLFEGLEENYKKKLLE